MFVGEKGYSGKENSGAWAGRKESMEHPCVFAVPSPGLQVKLNLSVGRMNKCSKSAASLLGEAGKGEIVMVSCV